MNKDNQTQIDYLKWLIDQKLEHFRSLDSRIIQIIGVNGIFLAIIWNNYFSNQQINQLDTILFFIYALSIFSQILLYSFVGKPKKSDVQLDYKTNNKEKVKNMKSYLKFIKQALESRAKLTLWIYRIFISQIVLITFWVAIVIFS